MALGETKWAQIRLEWEFGLLSNRELARKHGLDERAIRKRASKLDQAGGAWVKDPKAREEIEARARQLEIAAALGQRPVGVTTGKRGRGRPRGSQRRSGETAQPPGRSPHLRTDFPAEGMRTSPNSDNWLAGQATEKPAGKGRKVRTLTGLANAAQAADFPAGAAFGPVSDMAEAEPMARVSDPDLRTAMRAQVIEAQARDLAAANIRHLGRLEIAGSIVDRLGQLLDDYLAGSEEVGIRASQALSRLLAGRGDSLGGHLQAYMKALGSLQTQMRRALGADDRSKVDVMMPGAGPQAVPSQLDHGFDVTALPTDQLTALLALADLVTAQQGEAPLPMPPPDPGARDC
ncbi:hypothetical protein [Roseicella aerolata]|uniref:Uncharacterized protein n=1 Tax=Roseicella aerolata TaxID=2883479 RepID=A0A9X1IJ05_9PROT|nr:hypothetical protein [Roseicella aerolata]MCB4825540.1 hypothetical protein [Roseicella aerolata]